MALAKARQARQQPVQAEDGITVTTNSPSHWARARTTPRGVGDLAQRGAYLQGVEPAVLTQAQDRPLADEQGQAERFSSSLISWLIAEWVTCGSWGAGGRAPEPGRPLRGGGGGEGRRSLM